MASGMGIACLLSEVRSILLVACRGMASEMGITDFSTAVQWKALAVEALQGPRVTALGRLQQRKWLWAGGAVLGGFQARARSS